ncbi:hypothetical protein Tco_0084482 [Tanacetum coccineum]
MFSYHHGTPLPPPLVPLPLFYRRSFLITSVIDPVLLAFTHGKTVKVARTLDDGDRSLKVLEESKKLKKEALKIHKELLLDYGNVSNILFAHSYSSNYLYVLLINSNICMILTTAARPYGPTTTKAQNQDDWYATLAQRTGKQGSTGRPGPLVEQKHNSPKSPDVVSSSPLLPESGAAKRFNRSTSLDSFQQKDDGYDNTAGQGRDRHRW